MADTEIPDDKKAKFEKLRKLQDAYAALLPDKLEQLNQEWAGIRQSGHGAGQDVGAISNDRFGKLKNIVHNLAGSAGTFGYHQVSDVAKALELVVMPFTDYAQCSITESAAISALIAELSNLPLLAQENQERFPLVAKEIPVPRVNKSPRGQLICVIEDDEPLAGEMRNQLMQYGYDVQVFKDATVARHALERQTPAAMVVDLNLPEGRTAGADLVKEFKNTSQQDVPRIFISSRDDWMARLEVVRAGGGIYLTKPVDFGELLDRLSTLTVWQEEESYRVLLVDDEQVLAEHYALVLNNAGMETKIVENVADLLTIISEFQPDVILMDIFMPECSGLEAAAIVRQKSELLSTPIVFLSTEVNYRQQLEALQLGGDDFLQKPIADAHLVAAVQVRVKRFRKLRSHMQVDALSGLLNHGALKTRLESEVHRALRQNSPLVFAMLDIDYFKRVNDQYGHPVGDEVIKNISRLLKQRLRNSDIVGRYGGEEFGVILPDTSLIAAERVLDALREQFSLIKHQAGRTRFSCTFSVGLASVPPLRDLNALIQAADEALYLAKEGGRNRLCVSVASLSQ